MVANTRHLISDFSSDLFRCSGYYFKVVIIFFLILNFVFLHKIKSFMPFLYAEFILILILFQVRVEIILHITYLVSIYITNF